MATLRENHAKLVKLLVGPTCKIPRSTQRSERSGIRRSAKICQALFHQIGQNPTGHLPTKLLNNLEAWTMHRIDPWDTGLRNVLVDNTCPATIFFLGDFSKKTHRLLKVERQDASKKICCCLNLSTLKTTHLKFNSSPLKSYRAPKGK